ncbi:MAG: hypothetical protein ACYC8T_15970 [Myxococcaceae bacterium]
MGEPKRYEVLNGGARVLTFSAERGVLLSTAARPPGFTPPPHPFLNAQAHDARFEDQLAELLRRAKTVDDFIRVLEAEGFEVRKLGGTT